MLYILFICTICFIIIFGVIRTGNIFNPLTYFSLFWGIWTIVSLGNPFMLYDVSTKTYMIIWLNVVATSIGFFVVNHKKNKNHINVGVDKQRLLGGDLLNTRFFLFLQFFLSFILIYFAIKYNNLLFSMTTADMRRIVYEQGLLFGSSFSSLLYFWIITPLVKVSILALISDLVVNGKKGINLGLALFNSVLFAFIGNGRFIYFEIIIFTLISFGFKYDLFKKVSTNFKKRSNISKSLYVIFFVFVVYFMNLSSAKRIGIRSPSLSESVDVFVNYSLKQLVIYFTGPFRSLDFFLSSQIYKLTGYTYGRSFFSGIEEMINTFLIFLSGNSFSFHTANEKTASFTVNPILIGDNTTFNAFYTSIMNFYLDGGLPLVLSLSLLFGVSCAIFYRYYLNNSNLITFSLNVYLVYQMVATAFRWNYSAPHTWLAIGLILVVNKIHNDKTSKSSKVPQINS
ncbi:hypothetical protein H70357_28035 [Paenibacillus sp. FSL H7-0357]|uniref:O-antigen polymerase n=1 Tax=Paenibacillus sp. FSL H7-0357 TaxID=1536774 RepID=UPI0004F8306E|nr:O-antigen polymerase [Paenibacillus sp. FSL H7-0357]AIQ20127.1 hypothetical protein H70357_28035 [Paenibacillus sp. FSL H7-0357]